MVLAQRFAIPPRYMKFIARFRLEGLGAFVALLASLLMYFNALIFSFRRALCCKVVNVFIGIP
jgi:hypothetical protein